MKRKLLTVAALAMVSGTLLNAQTFIFNKNSAWKYNDTNTALADQWKSANYDVTAWPQGNGPLGYGDPVTTTTANNLISA
jgi:hypothetical protein